MKACVNCGTALNESASFCDICGSPQPTVYSRRQPQVYPRYSMPPFQYSQTPQSAEDGEWDVWRIATVFSLISLLIGFGVGAVVFSWQQPTNAQTVTLTTLITVSQVLTETRTLPITITQTSASTSTLTTGTTGVYREIVRFTGSAGAMTTQSFAVSKNMWRITWSYGTSQSASFSFSVYQQGQTAPVESVSSTKSSDSSITYINQGPAIFYLKITAENVNYTIIIEIPTS